jgi:hypothetical protein
MKQAVDLLGLSKAEVVSFLETIGEPAYRGRQVFAGTTASSLSQLR